MKKPQTGGEIGQDSGRGVYCGLDIEDLPLRPQGGLTSVEAGGAIPEPYWRAAGFYVAGSRAVRIDMLERLSDLIRARIAFRAAEGSEAPPGATGRLHCGRATRPPPLDGVLWRGA